MAKNLSSIIRFFSAAAVTLVLASTAQAASDKTTNTLLGAGLGAAAGAVLSEGDPLVTIGSAAAGGVLGNVLTDNSRRHPSYRAKYSKHPKHRYVKHSYHNGWSKKHHKKKYRRH